MEAITQTRYFSYPIENTTVYFKETWFGNIIPTAPNKYAETNHAPSKTFLSLVETYKTNAKKIRDKYGPLLSRSETLDWSHLGLTQLPPHILLECKKVKKLDISGNQIHFLPAQLQTLPLEELNISGNERLQPNIPQWLGKMRLKKLIANDIKMDFIPEGLERTTIISTDLPARLAYEYGETPFSAI